MRKVLIILSVFLFNYADVMAATKFAPKKFNTITSHNDVYPYLLNNTKTNVNKNTTTNSTGNAVSSAPIGKRNVVKRKSNARAATTANTIAVQKNTNTSSTNRRVVARSNSSTARAASNVQPARINQNRNNQNVIARQKTPVRTRSAKNVRTANTITTASSTERVSSQRCMADYKECMEMYCQREDTAYNRCYCSAKLAQIDSKYQNKIDSLVQEIVKLQYGSSATSDEIKEYWDSTVGSYTGTNPWVNIDNALNIEWADTQSRVRGQNAFNTGHEYCIQHLRACYYMASNLRDAYKSEIARDCETYEKSLQKIQEAAESVIGTYND
nr:hypothetical protein [Candidatus Enterousia merdequi]